jgi:PIN domain nuclease of toxin-antitoxin system
MKYLLDSHVLVWLFAKPDLVGASTKSLLSSADSEVFVSLATLWELELKFSKGRFAYSAEVLQEAISDLGVTELTIHKEHILASSLIKIKHTDPFDLMLCAQAKAEGMKLVTADKKLLENVPETIDARA